MNLNPTTEHLSALLRQPDFSGVYAEADHIRHENVGDTVHIRAILEFSSCCRRRCRYCGLNADNPHARRYRMEPAEMLAAAAEAVRAGYRTIVLQSGEDAHFTPALLGEIIRGIKALGATVTVSCGEMDEPALRHLRACGADRYLLKHETASEALYASLHPCGTLAARTECLRTIKRLGFETGGGFMVGLPGQTPEIIAQDLLLLRELSCDMAGIGPFIAHPQTPLAGAPSGSTELTKRAVALARILLPKANLPATTSLGVLNSGEKNDVFSKGANVIMRKITPPPYREMYEIYPAHFQDTSIVEGRQLLEEQIRALGRNPL